MPFFEGFRDEDRLNVGQIRAELEKVFASPPPLAAPSPPPDLAATLQNVIDALKALDSRVTVLETPAVPSTPPASPGGPA